MCRIPRKLVVPTSLSVGIPETDELANTYYEQFIDEFDSEDSENEMIKNLESCLRDHTRKQLFSCLLSPRITNTFFVSEVRQATAFAALRTHSRRSRCKKWEMKLAMYSFMKQEELVELRRIQGFC
jgi:hypothetical protein